MDKFCYVPFRELYFENLETPHYSSCCTQEFKHNGNIFTDNTFSFENNSDLQKLRKQFLKGHQPKTCSRCWGLEDRGLVSYRQQWNLKYKHVSRTDKPTLEVIDVRLTNKCNLQCKMCYKEFSHQIALNQLAALEAGIPVTDNIDRIRFAANYNNARQLDGLASFIINNKSIKQINLAGGEPMIMPEVEQLLSDLVSANRTNLKIFIITNATTVKSKVIETLEQFDKVEVSCSIDGIGKWIEYQRFPASWKVISKNYTRLTESKKIVATLTPCWSQLNLLGIVEYFKWLETEIVYGLSFNEVTWPTYLNWQLVPMKYRQELINQLDDIKIPNRTSDDYKSFIRRIKTDVREITESERNELFKAVAIWDFNNKIKYVDFCPWGRELLGLE